MNKTCYLGLVAAVLAIGAGNAAAEAESLDAALKKHAPDVIKYLRDHKYDNIGVLKFVVKQGDQASDNAGPLNLSMANRLEVALVLANPDEKLGIIERASAAVVRAKNRRANHLSPEGRAALFQVREYALAWGDRKQVEANAFVTGVVEISKDHRKLNVTVQAFDRHSKSLETICTFTAPVDFRTLAEIGRSYHLATRGPNESELLAQAIDHSQAVNEKKENHPVENAKSPIELKILYNGTAVRLVNGTTPEPLKGDRVTFKLNNRSSERFGVVLKVNGENTLFREPFDAPQCHKWILNPGEEVKVEGFQMGVKEAKEFEVLSPEESEKDVVNYGAHAGTFSMVVFRETKIDRETAAASFDIAAISRGSLSPNGKKPGTLAVLQAALKEKGDKARADGQRGIVAPGQDITKPIQYVSFKPDLIPVTTATIRYYQPGK